MATAKKTVKWAATAVLIGNISIVLPAKFAAMAIAWLPVPINAS
jgi:hypothetical protein